MNWFVVNSPEGMERLIKLNVTVLNQFHLRQQ